MVHVPVEHVNATVEAKQVVELGHEIEGDGPGRQLVSGMGPKEGGGGEGALRARTTGDGCWASSLGRGGLDGLDGTGTFLIASVPLSLRRV